MILQIYTIIHTIISLIGIFTGLVALGGLLAGKRLDGWTKWFLITTTLTSVTGFFFPFHGFTPAIGVGIISCIVLAIAIYARYPRRLAGAWRWIYVITATIALYLNCFVAGGDGVSKSACVARARAHADRATFSAHSACRPRDFCRAHDHRHDQV